MSVWILSGTFRSGGQAQILGDKAYDLQGLRADGSVYTGEVLGIQSEDEAKRLAQHYADLWNAAVELYRVPFVHIGSEPWAEGQMHLIARFEPKP
jgi:hypothetical protein